MKQFLYLSSICFLKILFILINITGCASSYQLLYDPSEEYNHNIEQLIREEVKLWTDTPHRMGGTTSSGTDCSGFVMIVYDKLFRIKLPRDTTSQAATGIFIDKKDLKPGDLIFFKRPKVRRHVGIYINSGEFAHTSSRKGVTISRLDDPGWNKYYWTSRRILP